MSASSVLDGHRAFRAMLLAMARPGTRMPLRDAPDTGVAASQLLSSTWTVDDDGVVVLDGEVGASSLLGLRRGTDERPEDGATVLIVVPDAAEMCPVRLRGPGVDGEVDTTLPLAPDVLAARAEACRQWPLGIDLVFVEPGPVVLGLPRTTRVEVVN